MLALIIAILALPMSGLALGSASATVLHGSDVASYSGSYEDCGFIVDVVGEFSSEHSMARLGKGDAASAFFGHDTYTCRETHTRRDTGKVLILTDRALIHDVRAERVDGSVFQFTTDNVGQFMVTTQDGSIVSRDGGHIRTTYLFDTRGDSTPGGDFIEFLSEEFNGHFGDFDLCAAFSE